MKKQFIVLFAFLVFITMGKAQTVQLLLYTDETFTRNLNMNSNVPVGITAGALDVNPTGSVSYTIPITLPPDTKGFAPSVTVSYNSQAGNGIMGMGWNVAASSAISRTGKNQVFDNDITAVKLKNEDFYALDGNRLEITSGTSGANASQYATHVETFSKR